MRWKKTGGLSAGPDPAALLRILAAFLLIAALSAEGRAEGISGYVDYLVTDSESKTTDSTGLESRSDIFTFLQRYNLILEKRPYPNLRFLASGIFEKSDSTGSVELGESKEDVDSTGTKVRPFVDLSLSTPLYFASAAYSRIEDTQKSLGAPSLRLLRDQYAGTLGWRPDGFPSLRFQWVGTETRDGNRAFLDRSEQIFQLTSDYQPVALLSLYYQGTLVEAQDMLNDIETSDISHQGRASYTAYAWNRRISVGADYSGNYRETEARAGGEGEVSVILVPLSGLSAIDDTPQQGALAANPALVDGDMQAAAGLNLGFQPGDIQRRNMGLDFGVPTEVNTLFVRVDRELPPAVANSFSWEIYSSSDNLNWVFRQTVSPAPLDPFVTRFEIRFANIASRFIKAVVRPLALTVPQATEFPIIQVTELQAALLSPAAAVEGRRTSTTHIYNLAVRARILDVPQLYYELSHSLADTTGTPPRWVVANGLFATHQLSPRVSATARIAREDAEDTSGRRQVSHMFTGALEAISLPTLRHNLLLTGRTDETDGQTRETLSLLLYNSAALYKGIDANLTLGRSRNVGEDGQTMDTTQADANAVIVPNRRITVNLIYSDKRDTISGGGAPAEQTRTTRSQEAAVAFYPVDTVYLYGSYRVEDLTGQGRRDITNYSASWTPFPGGMLHLGFFYTETLRSEGNARERTVGPNVRLDFRRGSFISLSYQDTSNRSDVFSSDLNVLSANVRVAF